MVSHSYLTRIACVSHSYLTNTQQHTAYPHMCDRPVTYSLRHSYVYRTHCKWYLTRIIPVSHAHLTETLQHTATHCNTHNTHRVIRLSHVRDMTRACMSLSYHTRISHVCAHTLRTLQTIHVLMCVICDSLVCDMTRSHLGHDSGIYICDIRGGYD